MGYMHREAAQGATGGVGDDRRAGVPGHPAAMDGQRGTGSDDARGMPVPASRRRAPCCRPQGKPV